jgi:predicted tellurium resistance membrane protein TerC
MMTAVIFAAIVLYFSNVRGTLTSNPILEYSMLAVLFLVGMRFLFAMVMAINKMHEPIEK